MTECLVIDKGNTTLPEEGYSDDWAPESVRDVRHQQEDGEAQLRVEEPRHEAPLETHLCDEVRSVREEAVTPEVNSSLLSGDDSSERSSFFLLAQQLCLWR